MHAGTNNRNTETRSSLFFSRTSLFVLICSTMLSRVISHSSQHNECFCPSAAWGWLRLLRHWLVLFLRALSEQQRSVSWTGRKPVTFVHCEVPRSSPPALRQPALGSEPHLSFQGWLLQLLQDKHGHGELRGTVTQRREQRLLQDSFAPPKQDILQLKCHRYLLFFLHPD